MVAADVVHRDEVSPLDHGHSAEPERRVLSRGQCVALADEVQRQLRHGQRDRRRRDCRVAQRAAWSADVRLPRGRSARWPCAPAAGIGHAAPRAVRHRDGEVDSTAEPEGEQEVQPLEAAVRSQPRRAQRRQLELGESGQLRVGPVVPQRDRRGAAAPDSPWRANPVLNLTPVI